MLSDRCPACPVLSICMTCLSVTLVYCCQSVGCIKVKLGMEVGLSPSHTVLDGDPAPPSLKGHSPHPIFGPCLLWPNGWMDQDATWYGARPRPRRHCVRWGLSFPLPKGTHTSFWPISIVAKRSPISATVQHLFFTCCGTEPRWVSGATEPDVCMYKNLCFAHQLTASAVTKAL